MAGSMPFLDQFVAGAPLPALRAAGLERYRATGLPGPALEAWKYTSLEALAQLGLAPAAAAPTPRVAVPEAAIATLDGYRAVLVNGSFAPALSTLDGLPRGATVESLAALIARDPAAAEAALGAPPDAPPLVALNTALDRKSVV